MSMTKQNVLLVLGIALIVFGGGVLSWPYLEGFFLSRTTSTAAVIAADPLDPSEPVRLRIPELRVDTSFVPLGLEDNGEIEVPESYTEVGWYTHGPTPGEKGPAVVLGHVDSRSGPGVFMFLGQLRPGDPVYVDRADGSTATFTVTALERYDRDAFPTEKIYGDLPYAGIRLITCSGIYNRVLGEYNRVLVVYGELAEEGESPENVVE